MLTQLLDLGPIVLITIGVVVLVLFGVLIWLIIKYTRINDPEADQRKSNEISYNKAQKRYNKEIIAFEKSTKGHVITMIHDLTGIAHKPEAREAPAQIFYHEAFEIIDQIRKTPKKQKIRLIIHTLGGASIPAIMIADAMQQHPGKVALYIPYIAMSGGTVLALAADEVYMGSSARLGPIDTVYNGFSCNALAELFQIKSGLNQSQDDETILLMLEAKKYEQFSKVEMGNITNPVHTTLAEGNEKTVTEILSSGKMSHYEAINAESVRKMGMKIEHTFPPTVYEIANLKKQMIKTGPDAARSKENKGQDKEDELKHKVSPSPLRAVLGV